MIFEQKQAFRKEVKLLLSKLSVMEIAAKSEAVWRQVEQLEEFRQAATVLLFASLPTEVQTQSFMQRWNGQKQFLLPIVHGDTLLVGASSELRASACFGLLEPVRALTEIPPIDLAIIPGLAFDRHNNRLGRGKGYYDRFLKVTGSYKVGVCFACQLFEQIPHEEQDVKMDRVLVG
jgi:5-formyltetrahydrofolate cyclo-ligase